MPTLPEILAQLQFISQEATLVGLFITGGSILLARNWRFLILALLIQYVLVGLILARFVRPDIATLQVMIGAFICPILFLSARQVSVNSTAVLLPEALRGETKSRLGHWWQNSAWTSLLRVRDRRRLPAPTGLAFRVFLTLLLILVATTLSNTFVLPGLSLTATLAVYWLVLAGLVTLTLTEYPMKVGHGLFTALSGFELLYATLEKSLLLTGLWGAANLLLALAIGYLTVVRGASPEEEGW